jgi:hypothetical protein
MLFVDGENLAIRGRKVADKKGILLQEGDHYLQDVFLWFPGTTATQQTVEGHLPLQPHAIRAFYYTSVRGDAERCENVRERLWRLGFAPVVAKREGEGKAKGVDIALSGDFLSNAFRNNFDVTVLIAGDGDYVPLIKEVQSLGKVVYVTFFEREGLSPALRLASDRFQDLTPALSFWKNVSARG